MAQDLTLNKDYHDTIARLEAVKHEKEGVAYWRAREIHAILGYPNWDKFEPVIARAEDSIRENKADPSHHIAQTSVLMGTGKGAQRASKDYFLTRAACRLIAMNGDPSKPEIAAAQAYFVVQTHRMEIEDKRTEEEKRLELRDKVKESAKRVSGVAQNAGVRSKMQGIFHDARYQGLYGMSLKDVKVFKGLKEGDQLLDRAGVLELSAHDFQMNLAADAIKQEGIRGEERAIAKNREVAGRVRKTMTESGAKTPEHLPLEPPIKEVKKRIGAQKKLPPSEPSA